MQSTLYKVHVNTLYMCNFTSFKKSASLNKRNNCETMECPGWDPQCFETTRGFTGSLIPGLCDIEPHQVASPHHDNSTRIQNCLKKIEIFDLYNQKYLLGGIPPGSASSWTQKWKSHATLNQPCRTSWPSLLPWQEARNKTMTEWYRVSLIFKSPWILSFQESLYVDE